MIGAMPGADRASSRFTRLVAAGLVALAAMACARRNEFIGTVPRTDGGAGDARDAEAGEGGTGDGAGGEAAEPAAFLCTPNDPPPPAVNEPAWNCPGRCMLANAAINPAAFEGAAVDMTATQAPVLVYPLKDSVHPLNLPGLTLQWKRPPGQGQTFFRIHIQPNNPPNGSGYDFYVPHQAPVGGPTPSPAEAAVYEIDGSVWRWIGSQNAGAEVQLTVTGFDPVANKIATSSPVPIRFSAAAVEGGLYYLGIVPSPVLWRQVFGAAAEPQRIVTPPVAGVGGLDCAGCHVLSRDGRRMAFAATYGGALTVVNTSNVGVPLPEPTKPTPADANAVAPALSPNGKYVFARRAVPNGDVELRDSTGPVFARRTSDFMGGRIDYPEWSPTRNEIVASRAESAAQPPGQPYAAIDGRIVIIPITSVADVPTDIEKPTVIATASGSRTYGNPTFSPDGNWIVFVSRPAGQTSYKSVPTRLHLINRDKPDTVYDLGHATGPTDSAATYPKFAPTALNHCKTFFLTFQSRMDYGLVRVTSQTSDIEWPQLWMTTIDLTRLTDAVSDPSSPPLWLPFQKITNKNLLPRWTAEIPCDLANPCGDGATCVTNRCVVTTN